jgi:hypothetical protein
MKKPIALLLIIALVFLVIVAVMIATGQASTTKPLPNTLGVAQFYTNPYTYLLALPLAGQVFEEKYTNIRFAPYAAADLFDVSILFCDDVTEQFKGKQGILVVTYRTQASRLYRGISCHELLSVFEVKG